MDVCKEYFWVPDLGSQFGSEKGVATELTEMTEMDEIMVGLELQLTNLAGGKFGTIYVNSLNS